MTPAVVDWMFVTPTHVSPSANPVCSSCIKAIVAVTPSYIPFRLGLLPPPRRIYNRRCLFFVCLSVCLYVCYQLCAKTSERICMIFSEKVGNGPVNKWLNFGSDPFTDSDPDPGTDPDPDRDTGKTCLGGGMHWPCASIMYSIWSSNHDRHEITVYLQPIVYRVEL